VIRTAQATEAAAGRSYRRHMRSLREARALPTDGSRRGTPSRRAAWRRLAPRGLALVALVGGCTASSEEVRPPSDQVFFPTGVALSPDDEHLFVLSANSELRYDSGTVSVIPLDRVDAVIEDWVGTRAMPPGCAQDLAFSETLVCDEAQFIRADAGVRLGNFATSIGVQDLGGGDLRLVVPVRGDPSLTWIDWDPVAGELVCGDGGGFQLCDDDHRLVRFIRDDSIQIPDEPFNVFVDSGNEWAMVTHITTGTVTLVDLPVDGSPVLADVVSGLFASDPQTGRPGAVGVAGRTPGEPNAIAYVTSRSENRVQTLTVVRPLGGAPRIAVGDYFFLDRVGGPAGGSSDGRAIAFGQGGDVAYIMNREPPSLALIDTSLDATGKPRNVVSGATDLCREASGLAVADAGDGERAFVSCFQSGQLYVIDPRAGVEVEAIALVGRGPFSVVASAGRRRLYVTNFFEETIAVVDIDPASPLRYRVVLRIGKPPAS
jgi:DNA-binding beta-propeller fold protein YncE